MNKSDLINLHLSIENILEKFKSNKKFGFDLPIDDFCLLAKFLNPQSYGNRVQCYFAEIMDYILLPSSFDNGDFLNKYNEIVEFKCSFLTKLNRDINVKNIRKWQNEIKYYYIFTVDFLDFNNLTYRTYKLTKQELYQEIEILNASACHSTKIINEKNENIEVGFSIKIDSNNYKRWCDLYLLKDFDIKSLSQKTIDSRNYVKEIENELIQLKLLLDKNEDFLNN